MFRPWLAPTTGFNFSESLCRLGEASQYGFLHLEEIVTKELSSMPPFSLPASCSSPTRIDPLSQYYTQHCRMQDFGVPYYATGDGNCLFNAVSLSLCGTESLATELRVRTCIEMVVRKDMYMSMTIAKSLIWVSPNYISSAIDCAKHGGWSSIWTVYALAEVIGLPIQSVYPPLNGVQDMSYRVLNLTAVPRNAKEHLHYYGTPGLPYVGHHHYTQS